MCLEPAHTYYFICITNYFQMCAIIELAPCQAKYRVTLSSPKWKFIIFKFYPTSNHLMLLLRQHCYKLSIILCKLLSNDVPKILLRFNQFNLAIIYALFHILATQYRYSFNGERPSTNWLACKRNLDIIQFRRHSVGMLSMSVQSRNTK